MPIVALHSSAAEEYRGGPFIVIVQTREGAIRWLHDPMPGLEGIQLEGLIGDPEVWAFAAQGCVDTPLDVALSDPAAEFSLLYRLVDVRNVRPVRVTIPAKPGFLKAMRLAVSLQLPVRILPGQPDSQTLAEIAKAVDFYLHDPMVETPVEFFHSVLAAFRGKGEGTLWMFLDQDPSVLFYRDAAGHALRASNFVATHLSQLVEAGAECASCPWQSLCAGYFKSPDPAYNCAGVKELFGTLKSAADEIARDLATCDAANA